MGGLLSWGQLPAMAAMAKFFAITILPCMFPQDRGVSLLQFWPQRRGFHPFSLGALLHIPHLKLPWSVCEVYLRLLPVGVSFFLGSSSVPGG